MYSYGETALDLKCGEQKSRENSSLGYSKFLPTESLKDLLSPELKKSRFVAFKEKFLEDMYFKKAKLGQALVLHSKPQELTNESFVYGLKGDTSESGSDLISPNKTPHEIREELLKWHDKYLISHKSYLPSERINRNYNENYNPQATYGITKTSDRTGHSIKKCMQQGDRLIFINKAQKYFFCRTNGQLGKTYNRYRLNLDAHQTFVSQQKNKTNYDVRALIENVEPSAKQIEIIEAVSHINKLRRFLFTRTDFNMYDLRILLEKYDENKSGFITFNSVMKALRSLQINANEQKLYVVVSHFKMFNEEKGTTELVNIEKFWKMLHIQYPLPREFSSTVLTKNPDKQTTYRSLCSDRKKFTVSEKNAKITSNLKDDKPTTAGDLIAPDIPMQYGLCSNDFNVLRSKDELKRIFQLLLPQNFDQVWEFAWLEKFADPSCRMSVNELRNVLDQYNSQYLK